MAAVEMTEQANPTGGGEVGAVRIDAAKAPPDTRVADFEMHPMYAYERVLQRLKPLVEQEAMEAFMAQPDYDRRGYHHVEDLDYELSPGELAERGVVLLPCYVCEYSHEGNAYRCFISGTNGNVTGVTRHTTGLLRTFLASLPGGDFLVRSLPRGAIDEDWRMAERNRKIFEQRHGKWLFAKSNPTKHVEYNHTLAKLNRESERESERLAFWQGEMARVLAGELPAGDLSTEESQQAQEAPLRRSRPRFTRRVRLLNLGSDKVRQSSLEKDIAFKNRQFLLMLVFFGGYFAFSIAGDRGSVGRNRQPGVTSSSNER